MHGVCLYELDSVQPLFPLVHYRQKATRTLARFWMSLTTVVQRLLRTIYLTSNRKLTSYASVLPSYNEVTLLSQPSKLTHVNFLNMPQSETRAFATKDVVLKDIQHEENSVDMSKQGQTILLTDSLEEVEETKQEQARREMVYRKAP
ncbi:hypothetical protein PV326_013692 [Microctonus aethiopoides]|nr:hypothetical protein PV326_013692 [Microctonus aethiopoides]